MASVLLWFSSLLSLLAAGLLYFLAWMQLQQLRRDVALGREGFMHAEGISRLAGSGARGGRLRVRLSDSRLMRSGQQLWRARSHEDPRLSGLSRRLRQAGYVGTRAQVMVLAAVSLIALALSGLWALYTLAGGEALLSALTNAALGLLLVCLIAWLWLGHRVQERSRSMEKEVELLIQVTRMLWESGMTLEGVLRSLIINLGDNLPASLLELQLALARIEAGRNREEVLEELSELQPYEGLSDYFNLLAQVSVSGGAASGSLRSLSELLQDQRRTRLQQELTRMSGKMSLVMMITFFPALVIYFAGPAAVNIAGLLLTFRGQ